VSQIYFSKVKENATIPSKRSEDAAVDIYACFNEPTLLIEPSTSKLIPTGIASAFPEENAFIFYERGYSGSRNLKVNAGVVDSGFRGEWFVCLYNANRIPVIISKLDEAQTKALVEHWGIKEFIHYPYGKAIAQALFISVPNEHMMEISYDDLKTMKSERMEGSLGSSQK
jgi:dUTP pyrophosphatase